MSLCRSKFSQDYSMIDSINFHIVVEIKHFLKNKNVLRHLLTRSKIYLTILAVLGLALNLYKTGNNKIS